MTPEELSQSWEITKSFLEAAKNWLPLSIIQTDQGLIRYREWLEHNELELALDELENVGEKFSAPSQFWKELSKARNNMGLSHQLDIVCSTCWKCLATYDAKTDSHRLSPDQLLAAGAVPVPNFGWFCTQTCGDEYEETNGRKLFQRDADGNIRYY